MLKFNKYTQFTYNRQYPAVLYKALRSPRIRMQNEILCCVLVPWRKSLDFNFKHISPSACCAYDPACLPLVIRPQTEGERSDAFSIMLGKKVGRSFHHVGQKGRTLFPSCWQKGRTLFPSCWAERSDVLSIMLGSKFGRSPHHVWQKGRTMFPSCWAVSSEDLPIMFGRKVGCCFHHVGQ